ncbi:MAG: PAS domain S-box protein [Candidatus Sungbacteria bacterium]|nr:PAS domain S-box protein [Candidatus Sungbacteria bacterium]
MPIRLASIIFGIILALIGLVSILASRASAPLLVKHERQTLVSIFPLVNRAILGESDWRTELPTLKRHAGIDITLVTPAGAIEGTTLDGVARGARLDVGSGGQTVFELASLGGKSTFVLSSPVRISGSDFRLVVSKPDELLGPFFDELFTAALFAAIAGLGLSFLLAYFITHRERLSLAAIQEAIAALASKNYRFRLSGSEVLGSLPRTFNQVIEGLEAEGKSTDELVRSQLAGGKSERKAFEAALSSVLEGVLIIDHLGRIQVLNSALGRLSGLVPESVTGKAFSDVVTLAGKNKVDQLSGLVTRVLSTGISEVFPEGTLLKKQNGDFVPVRVKVAPIKDELRNSVTHAVILVEEARVEAKPESKLDEKREAKAVVSAAKPPPVPKSEPTAKPAPSLPPAIKKPEPISEKAMELLRPHAAPAEPVKEKIPVLAPAMPLAVSAAREFVKTTHLESEPLPVLFHEELPMVFEVREAMLVPAAAGQSAPRIPPEVKREVPETKRELPPPPLKPAAPAPQVPPSPAKSPLEKVLEENERGSLEVLRKKEVETRQKEVKREIAELVREGASPKTAAREAPHNLPV